MPNMEKVLQRNSLIMSNSEGAAKIWTWHLVVTGDLLENGFGRMAGIQNAVRERVDGK